MSHENSVTIETRLAEAARAAGLSGPFQVNRARIDPGKIPAAAALVFDDPVRIADSLSEFVKIAAELTAKGCRLIRGTDPSSELFDLRSHRTILAFLALLPGLYRAGRIRESLAARKLAGARLGREPLSREVQDEILRVYGEVKSVRATARRMAGRASRSSVLRTLRARGIKP
jgi:DNA invertase Pin-like site-specific DNA recombinase